MKVTSNMLHSESNLPNTAEKQKITSHVQPVTKCDTETSEAPLKAAPRLHVNMSIGARSCPSQQSLRPRRLLRRKPLRWLCCSLHVEPHNSVSISVGRQDAPLIHKLHLQKTFSLSELNMTFRRLKKVNSSGPDSGAASQDGDVYFPSSKSDSCRTTDLPGNSSEVYNYKTLAYSGGTLPRNYKRVKTKLLKTLFCLDSLLIHWGVFFSIKSSILSVSSYKLEGFGY